MILSTLQILAATLADCSNEHIQNYLMGVVSAAIVGCAANHAHIQQWQCAVSATLCMQHVLVFRQALQWQEWVNNLCLCTLNLFDCALGYINSKESATGSL